MTSRQSTSTETKDLLPVAAPAALAPTPLAAGFRGGNSHSAGHARGGGPSRGNERGGHKVSFKGHHKNHKSVDFKFNTPQNGAHVANLALPPPPHYDSY
jgi:hypothetical protein